MRLILGGVGVAHLAVRPLLQGMVQPGGVQLKMSSATPQAVPPPLFRRIFRKGEHDREIATLALPALMSLLVDPVLSVVDTVYVGRLGPTALASLGPCTSVFHLSFNTFRALTQSTTALVSRSLARGEVETAGDITQQSIVLGLFLGLLTASLLLHNAATILAVMGVPRGTALFAQAYSYLTVRATAAPAVLLAMVLEGTFRGNGDTVTPAIASLTAAVANIILDPVMMFGMGWGVAGAAAATVVAQYMAVACYLVLLVRRARRGTIVLPAFGPAAAVAAGKAAADRVDAAGGAVRVRAGAAVASVRKAVPLLRRIVGANAAMLMRTTSLMTCWAVASAVATRMGEAHVASHQVALSLWLLLALVAEAPSIASQVLGARYLGQDSLAAARSVAARCLQLTLAGSLVLGAGLFALSHQLPAIFTSDLALQARLVSLMPVLAAQQPLVALTLVMEGLLIGAGAFKWLAATTAVGTTLSAFGILAVGRWRSQWGVQGVWAGITLMFVLRFASALWLLVDRKNGPYWRASNKEKRVSA